MSQSGAIEIIAVTGEAFLFGPASDRGPGERITHSSGAAWTQWLHEWFGDRFNTQVSHWEAVLTMVGPWQPAMTPSATFQDIATHIQAGALEARRLPPPSKPMAVAPVGAPVEAMRSQQAGAKGAPAGSGVGAASKGVADDDMGPDLSQQQCLGDPVAPVTGEEILTLEDFHISAPMPLTWQRWYRSRHCERDLGLGAGWFAECLRLIWQDEDATWLLDQEARPVCMPLLAPGEIAWQAVGGQRLERRHDNRMLLTETDGRVWTFAPDPQQQWRPTHVHNTRGHQWCFLYDERQRLAQIELSPRKTLALTYGPTGHVSQIHLLQEATRQLLVSYDQDADGNLIAATVDSGTERYGYQQHLLTRRELPSGYLFLFHWDGTGPRARCLRSHGEDGRFDYRFDYQPEKYQTRVTDGDGQSRVFHYDAQNRIVARQEADGGIYQWAYDTQGRLAAYRLPDGRTTRYGYDAQGRKIRERLPDGREHRWVYNALGACTAESLPDGRTLSRRFDLLGRLIEEQRPDGSQWRYRYTPEGWPKDAISSTGEVRRSGFNEEGELLATAHQGHLARQVFDPQGRLKGRLQADRVTEYDYSGQRLSAVHQYPQQTPQERRSRLYQYDPAGRLTRFTTATGDSHGFHYDGLARPTAYQRPDGKQVAYQYDKEQRLTGVTRPDGQQWSLTYDSKGQVSRCQAPDGRDIHFSYDAAGDIIQRQQGDEWVQHLKRDAGGRILQQDSRGRDRQAVHKTFTYDAFGRRTQAHCEHHTLAWRYDAQGRVSEHRQNSHTVQYRYGAGQQLKALQLPDGTLIQYHHDRYGRWQSLQVNGATVLTRELDEQGREQHRTAGDNQQTQTWDRYDCLAQRQWQGKERRQRHYHWDPESRLTHFSDEHQGEHRFHRDPQGQLTGEDHRQFNYDDGGNRLPELTDATGLTQDQLSATPEAKRRYDTLGAEIAVLGTTIEHRYFDAEGQLLRLKREALEVRYGYDAMGRRAWRESVEGTTTYLWHNDVLLGEQHPNGDWQWYIRDPQTDAPLFTLINGTPYHYELDWRGMPIRLWAEDGALVWQANADAWGKCRPEGDVHQAIRLPGQFEDELTGLYFNRFRDYDPETGRYLTPDPLGIKGGLNSYRYTPNPVDYIDPLGLSNCGANGPKPENAADGDMAPVTDDSPALQNVDVAVAASALARAPALAPAPTSHGITRIAVGTAANDAAYATQRSLLAKAVPIASAALTFVTGMIYSPALGGGMEVVTAPDGTVYSKHGDERIWNASGTDGTQWQTYSTQDDVAYRAWLANGGEGSFEDWISEGKPEVPNALVLPSGRPPMKYPVDTDPDTAFFWSGRTEGVGGEKIARQIAEDNGGTTLEALIEKREVKMPAWNTEDPSVVQAWKDISADYANGASGTVRAVIGSSLRPGNVWETAELPALKNNPNVNKIVTIDPVTGDESVIFERRR